MISEGDQGGKRMWCWGDPRRMKNYSKFMLCAYPEKIKSEINNLRKEGNVANCVGSSMLMS